MNLTLLTRSLLPVIRNKKADREYPDVTFDIDILPQGRVLARPVLEFTFGTCPLLMLVNDLVVDLKPWKKTLPQILDELKQLQGEFEWQEIVKLSAKEPPEECMVIWLIFFFKFSVLFFAFSAFCP